MTRFKRVRVSKEIASFALDLSKTGFKTYYFLKHPKKAKK